MKQKKREKRLKAKQAEYDALKDTNGLKRPGSVKEG